MKENKNDTPCPCCGNHMKSWLHLKKLDPQLPEYAGPIGRHSRIEIDDAGIIHLSGDRILYLIQPEQWPHRPFGHPARFWDIVSTGNDDGDYGFR